MKRTQRGIWFIGGRGSVATTTMVGLSALRKGIIQTTGLVSELPYFAPLGLLDWADLVVGGHDIRQLALADSAARLCGEENLFSPDILAAVRRDLAKWDRNVRPGTLVGVGSQIATLADTSFTRVDHSPRDVVERLSNDMREFVKKNSLQQLVVVNLASTEPVVDERQLPKRWSEMESTLDNAAECPLPASSLYAIAALQNGYAYINFTPSLGATPRAIQELAELRETCQAGCDGKTGETLLKTALAPMFAARNLQILSWVGHNIFGNLDGKVLDDPVNKATKVNSKDSTLRHILNYQPSSLVTIEYVPSLGDWKTAWDHIHFAGFLGTTMKMQFTWQGSDSILAAPLILDLVRFVLAARERGEVGALSFLASFFKSPLGTQEHAFAKQFQMLLDWAQQTSGR